MAIVRPFLERLPEDTRARLKRSWLRRRWMEREVILHHHDTDRDLYFLIEGQARASVATEDGKSVAFKDLVAGDIFGEFSAIDGRPRSADVVAVTDLTVARLPAAAFERIAAEDSAFAMALLGHVTEIARAMNTRVYEFSTMLVRERLMAELLRLARLGTSLAAGGIADGEDMGVEIVPAPTHQDIAARISTHREAVSREMSRLAKAGLVRREGNRLVIPSLAELRERGPEMLAPVSPGLSAPL